MFDAHETSRFDGKPIHLFILRRQNVSLRFASTGPGVDLTNGAFTYTGGQIERDAIRQTVERAKDKLKIRLAYLLDPDPPGGFPPTQELGDWWRPYIPVDPIHVTCLATHRGDTDPPIVEWMGWVAQPEFSDTELVLHCDPNAPNGEARGQGAKWQVNCFKTVYSTGIRGCNLDPVPLTVSGELTDVDGLTLTAAEFADSVFPLLGGTFAWERSNGLVEERPIVAHNGTEIQILWGGDDLDVGTDFKALPNCPGTWSACEARDNTINHGGAKFKPVKDPTNGVSMSWG